MGVHLQEEIPLALSSDGTPTSITGSASPGVPEHQANEQCLAFWAVAHYACGHFSGLGT